MVFFVIEKKNMDIEPNASNAPKMLESSNNFPNFFVHIFPHNLEIITLKPDQEFRVNVTPDNKIEINVY